MIELAADAYERTHDARYKTMVVQLYDGILKRYGTRWTSNHYNDDIMWMVLASLRAYEVTGQTRYRDEAKWHFDRVYARAWSRDLGGGLWWTTARREKNACINAPAAIAACELYETFHDRSYLRKAEGLYQWVKNTLFDSDSGSVSDRAFRKGTAIAKDPTNYTYNQGTFIGAADLLYAATHDRVYYHDALKALGYTRQHLTTDGILKSEGSGGDGGGFKGIFARWAAKFMQDNHLTAYDEWFQLNADDGLEPPQRRPGDGRGLDRSDRQRQAVRLRLLLGRRHAAGLPRAQHPPPPATRPPGALPATPAADPATAAGRVSLRRAGAGRRPRRVAR